MAKYGEEVVEGISAGLLNLDDTVTWKAKHFFKERRIKVRMTKLKSPDYFVDEQVNGDFILLKHEHYFKPIQNGTIMIDQFRYELPYAMLGKLLNKLYMEKYLTRLIGERNEAIKKAAESNGWKQFLNT